MRFPVIINVDSCQTDPDGRTEHINACYKGAMFEKDGHMFISYDEKTSDPSGNADKSITKSMLKISDERVELSKKGTLNYNMYFERGVKTNVSYATLYGSIHMTVETFLLDIKSDDPGEVKVNIGYLLDMGGGYVLKCEMDIAAELTEELTPV